MAKPSKKPSDKDLNSVTDEKKPLTEHQTRKKIEDIMEQRKFDKLFEL